MTDSDYPTDLMQRVGLLDPPETADYISRDTDLTADETITLLSEAGVLSPRQAEAYVYRRIEELDRGDTAAELDISKSAVDDYVRAAERKLTEASTTIKVLDLVGADQYAP